MNRSLVLPNFRHPQIKGQHSRMILRRRDYLREIPVFRHLYVVFLSYSENDSKSWSLRVIPHSLSWPPTSISLDAVSNTASTLKEGRNLSSFLSCRKQRSAEQGKWVHSDMHPNLDGKILKATLESDPYPSPKCTAATHQTAIPSWEGHPAHSSPRQSYFPR